MQTCNLSRLPACIMPLPGADSLVPGSGHSVWQGKLEEAAAAAEEAHKSLPPATDLRSFYVQLSLASSLAALGRLDEARKPAEQLQLVRAARLPRTGLNLAHLLARLEPCLMAV